jgi:Lon-like ATP-dependent protease
MFALALSRHFPRFKEIIRIRYKFPNLVTSANNRYYSSRKKPKSEIELDEDESQDFEDESAVDSEDDPKSSRKRRNRINGIASSKTISKLNTRTPAKIQIPETCPYLLAIPLTRRPIFPGFYKSMYIKDPVVIKVIQDLVKSGNPYVGIFLAKDEKNEKDIVASLDDVEKVGVFAQITNTYQTGPDNSSLTVVVYPHRRIRIAKINEVLPEDTVDTAPIEDSLVVEPASLHRVNAMIRQLRTHKVPYVSVENLVEEPFNAENRLIKATTSEVINVLKEISLQNPLLRDQIITVSVQTGNVLLNPSKLADFSAAISSGEPGELQAILESLVVEERLHKALVVLKKELANAKLQQEISQEVDRKINRKNQEYFLMEQLKGIKKELGMENDGKEKMIESFKNKAAKLKMPKAVETVFEEVFQVYIGD